MKVDLRRAATFHAVARAGGITAAAKIEGRSPPAIHADLRRFERDAGVSLMERVGRRLRLTPEGRTLFAVVDRALADIASGAERLAAGESSELPLRIGCVTAFGRYRLMPALFAAVSPHRAVHLRTDSQDKLLSLLAAGEIDFAVTYRPVVSAPLESRLLCREELWLVGPVDEAVRLEDLARSACVTYEEYEYVFACWFDQTFGGQPARLAPFDRTDELEEALLAVAAGRGFTIAPREACEAHCLERKGPAVWNDVALCAVGGRLRSPDADWLAALLADEVLRPSLHDTAGTAQGVAA